MTIEYKDSKRIVLNEADRTLNHGYAGGDSGTGDGGGGGGGGAGAVGANLNESTGDGGNGGAGLSNNIKNPPVESTDGSYTVLQFTGNGTFTPASSFNVDYIIVGGGGAGGSGNSFGNYGTGGGGGGQFQTASAQGVTAQDYSIVVGAGGSTVTAQAGTNGSSSSFYGVTSIGGGGGGGNTNNPNYNGGLNGASGGGGGAGGSATGGGTGSAGNNGGTGKGSNAVGYGGGGGGGSTSAGSNAGSVGGVGGTGTTSSITGTSIEYSGGGGGGGSAGDSTGTSGWDGGAGSTGGSGTAGTYNTSTDAPDNRGGGGGGSSRFGADGGSGVVIIRFLTSGNSYTITDGIGSIYYSGGGGGSQKYSTDNSGSGGIGGGGVGGGGSNVGASGGVNLGGGGGSGGDSGTAIGGAGGSGIVILRFTTSGNGYSQAGGTVITSGSDTIISWTATSGTRTFTPTSAFDVRYLVVAGGGGGGGKRGGGGGGGAYKTATGFGVTAQAYTITVGAGGAGGTSGLNAGASGTNSIFSSITSTGGGGGGSATNGITGGSGGGGGGNDTVGDKVGGSGTSSDATPTDVQDNSILVEKDTARRYWFGDETAISYNINNADTQQETRSGSTTSNGVQILSGNSAIGHKLSSIMFPLKKSGSPPNTFRFEVYNSAGTLQAQTPTSSANSLTTSFVDTTLTLTTPHTIVAGDRIVITYGSGDVSNKILVSEDNSVGSIPSNTTHTAYNSSWSESTSQWSNAKFTSTSATWTMEPTFRDDFSTDKGWVSTHSTKMAYNGTTDKLDLSFENENNNANLTIVKELDFTLGTKFVVRFVLDFSQFGGLPIMTMGVSDQNQTVNADTAQDYIGLVVHDGTRWRPQVKDAGELGTFTNIGQFSYSGHQSNFGTDYYCELIRNEDSFTINIRTGSHTGTSIGTATTTISTIGTPANLKYIKFGNYDATSANGYCTTTIDDIEIYNGVTSIN